MSRILDKVDQFYSSNVSSLVLPNAPAISPRQAAWDWIRRRRDVSVGKDRKWNHASLSDVLALPEEPACTESGHELPTTDAQPTSERQESGTAQTPFNLLTRSAAVVEYRPKVFVSEEQMWHSIAGHGADFKRVPKLEWAALVGIASTKKEGILQGDLCRLIGQDKRSLPKRTDSLAQKGYILKRTTLVRGVKTSKMWLSRCAPTLSSDHREAESGGHGQETALLMPPESFNRDMEPVAWRARWTGGSIDMMSLAETVVSIVRAFGIMRYHDLRQKLGILSLPWQMKVTARLCRWAVRRGILQYVGATLGDRLYKDCLKFIRDFTPEDWVEWLRTGKEKARPKSDADLDAYRHNPNGDTSSKRKKNKKADDSIDIMVAWKPEKPLTTTVLDAIRATGGKAVTNRHLGAHTLGPPFSRYVTSISTTLATPSLQPKHLAHFQVSKELMRVKKQAIYFFSLPRLHASAGIHDLGSAQTTEVSLVDPPHLEAPNSLDQYFSPSIRRAACHNAISLSSLARMTGRRDNATFNRAVNLSIAATTTTTIPDRVVARVDEGGHAIVSPDIDHTRPPPLPRVTRQLAPRTRGHRGRRTTTFVVNFSVDPALLAKIIPRPGFGLSSGDGPSEPDHDKLSTEVQARDPSQAASEHQDVDDDRAGVHVSSPHTLPEPASSTKRGRQKGTAASRKSRSSKTGSYRCDKCGGIWQNDNGLKYHLEKSSSSCNASYSAPPPKPPRYLSARSSLLSSAGTFVIDKFQGASTRRTRNNAVIAIDTSPATRTAKGYRQSARVSSAFQHAPALRARSHRRSIDSTRAQSIPALQKSADSLDAITVASAPAHFHAVLRDTAATLLDTPSDRADQVAEAHAPGKLPVDTDPSRRTRDGILDDMQPGMSAMPHENGLLTSQISCQPELPSPMLTSEMCSRAVDQNAEASRANLASHAVPFHMPSKSNKRKASNQRHNSQFYRSSEIIQHLLVVHGGIIPGDRSLWHALTAVWERTFPTDSPPNYGTTQGLIGKLVGRKILRKSVHAFRDSKGSFKSVTLLLAPEVDSQSSAVLDLKDQMIALHPQTYVLPGYIPASGLPDDMKWNGIPVFSTRRQLAQNVEVLDAPFYASRQASRKRPRPSEPPGRNVRRTQQHTADVASNQFSMIGDEAYHAAERAFGGSRGSGPRQPHEKQHVPGLLTFLEPNTCLQDDMLVPRKQRAHRSPESSAWKPRSDGASLGGSVGMPLEQRPSRQPDLLLKEPSILTQTERGWPRLRAEFFENNPSATMHGPLIPVSRAFARLLPGGLGDIVGPQWLVFHETASEVSYHSFLQQVESCAAWETDIQRGAQLARMQSIAPNHNWINLTMNVPMPTVSYRKLAWIRESPGPMYGMGARSASLVGTGARDVPLESGHYAKRRKLNEGPSRNTATVLPMDLTTRKMTPWNGTNEDCQPLPQGRRLDGNNDAVLIAAFVATRTLLGGADKYVEWGLLLRLFPKKSLAWLRKFWSKARKDRAASINKLTERFQERFVRAYEQNELPLIDFDDYLNYDWHRLVEWTLDLAGDAIQLPSSMAELEKEYVMDGLAADTSDWQRIYYSFQSSTFNRLEALTAGSTCTPVDDIASAPQSTIEDEELRKAKSWLRALCGTQSGTYKPADIRQKLCCITEHGDVHNNGLLGRAITALQNQNVITKTKQRSGDSGSHRFTEWFMPRFDKISQAHKFNDAVSFKAMLDGIFRKGDIWRVPYLLQDGEVLAMINMQAAGRIKVTPVDVPHIPLGFKPGFYESRKFPKSFYNFGLEVAPTETYVFNEDLAELVLAQADTPPKEGPAGKLPIWSDIFGKLAADRWGRTLRAVAFAVAMRGPLSIDGILTALAPFLEDFEIELVVEWGIRNQLFKQTVHGRTYTADEWWWLLAGSQYHEQLVGTW